MFQNSETRGWIQTNKKKTLRINLAVVGAQRESVSCVLKVLGLSLRWDTARTKPALLRGFQNSSPATVEHKLAKGKADAFSWHARLYVIKGTPTYYSMSQGPNSMLQNTLNKVHSNSVRLIVSQGMFQPWKLPHWLMSIKDPRFLGQQSKLTLLFFVSSGFRRCQSGETKEKEERTRYSSLLDVTCLFLLWKVSVVIAFLIILASIYWDLLKHFL